MIRSLALTVSFFLACAAPALAQAHPQTPDHGRSHDQSDHTPLDPSQHAAMHALLGNWTGTSSSPEAASRKCDLTVASDKLGNVTLTMKVDQPIRVGAASRVALEGNTLHWTQDVSGTPCKATAVLTGTTLEHETMKGSMTCDSGEMTFALQKTKG